MSNPPSGETDDQTGSMGNAAHNAAELGAVEYSRNPELTRALFGDLLSTLRLSQGNDAIHKMLTQVLAYEYQQQGISAEELDEAAQMLMDEVRTAKLPAKHKQLDAEQVRKNYLIRAGELRESARDAYAEPATYGSEHFARLNTRQLANDITFEDSGYVHSGRPERNPDEGDDPYESVVRDYILGDKMHGSRALMALRDRLRAELLKTHAEDEIAARAGHERSHLPLLADEWDSKHAPDTFWEYLEKGQQAG